MKEQTVKKQKTETMTVSRKVAESGKVKENKIPNLLKGLPFNIKFY